MLKAMAAPYGQVKFMPTGGLNEKNILSYLEFNKIVACGGSFMVKEEYIENGEYFYDCDDPYSEDDANGFRRFFRDILEQMI